eukprot:scaffold1171_cov144-Skeletonema_marinoi.AAC.4
MILATDVVFVTRKIQAKGSLQSVHRADLLLTVQRDAKRPIGKEKRHKPDCIKVSKNEKTKQRGKFKKRMDRFMRLYGPLVGAHFLTILRFWQRKWEQVLMKKST